MKKDLYNNFRCIAFTTLILLLFGSNSIVQGQTDFVVGAFIASSPNPDSTLFYNYEQILDCGFNSVFQYAKKTPQDNLTQLSQFDYVYAANDTAPQHTTIEGNKDWVSYFTHAKYFRWEAEGDDNFPIINSPLDDSTAGIRHQFGTSTGNGWSSGTNSNYLNQFLVLGPKYTQYMKYVYTNRSNPDNPLIQYNAIFNLKLGSPQSGSFDVAEIMVTVYDTKTKQESASLASWILTSDTLSTEFQPFTLTYNYGDFYVDNSGNNSSSLPPPSALDWIPFQENSTTPWIDFDKKVQFKVKWLSNVELIVDYTEVYDIDIWDAYYNRQSGYDTLVTKIANYNQDYSTLGSKLKYFYTIDEPHTWDSFIPIKKVQHILDSLITGRELLVHFYPGWNNRREQLSVLNRWVNIAIPKKLMFWYAPFTCDDKVTPCDPYDRNFTLYFLRQNLQNAHIAQHDFFTALQTFGVKEKNSSLYHSYNTPTPAELSSETMLALAHGCKGIFFEEYYSRESWSWALNTTVDVENLVDRLMVNSIHPEIPGIHANI